MMNVNNYSFFQTDSYKKAKQTYLDAKTKLKNEIKYGSRKKSVVRDMTKELINNVNQSYNNALNDFLTQANENIQAGVNKAQKNENYKYDDPMNEYLHRSDFESRLAVLDDNNLGQVYNRMANSKENIKPFYFNKLVERANKIKNFNAKENALTQLKILKMKKNIGEEYKNEPQYQKGKQMLNEWNNFKYDKWLPNDNLGGDIAPVNVNMEFNRILSQYHE